MTEPRKIQPLNLVIAAVISILLGGGSGLVMETKEQADLRQKVAELTVTVEFMKSSGEKQIDALADIDQKIERNNEYLRDDVVKVLNELKADVAVLKARR